MTIIHLRTTVTTVFATVDADGNVVAEHPIEAQLRSSSADAFAELAEELARRRAVLSTAGSET